MRYQNMKEKVHLPDFPMLPIEYLSEKQAFAAVYLTINR
jgi:hypothetical protein